MGVVPGPSGLCVTVTLGKSSKGCFRKAPETEPLNTSALACGQACRSAPCSWVGSRATGIELVYGHLLYGTGGERSLLTHLVHLPEVRQRTWPRFQCY